MIRGLALPLRDNQKRFFLAKFVANQLMWKFGPDKDYFAQMVIEAVLIIGYDDISDRLDWNKYCICIMFYRIFLHAMFFSFM